MITGNIHSEGKVSNIYKTASATAPVWQLCSKNVLASFGNTVIKHRGLSTKSCKKKAE